MTKLDLWTWKESIVNLPQLPDIASKFWVNDYKIVLKNISSKNSKVVEGYIAPTWKGLRKTPETINYNFSYNNLKLKQKPNYSIPFGKNLRPLINKVDYLFIDKDYSYDPDEEPYPIEKILLRFLSPYSDFTLFFKGVRHILDLMIWYHFYQHLLSLVFHLLL